MPPRTRDEHMQTEAHKALDQIAPRHELRELHEMMRQVPREYHTLITDVIARGTGRMEKILAAAAAAVYVREALKANSGVTLLPVGIAPGANCTPNTIYPLQPFTSGATSGPYQFVTDQVFFDLMTATVDTTNGWYFVSNSVKFSNDPLSGMAYGDTSFVNFEQDVVSGREILGEYSHHRVIEQLTFYASAILYNSAPKPMVAGVNLRFWDTRCKGEGVNERFFQVFSGPTFSEVVNDLVERANGGGRIEHLFRGEGWERASARLGR